MRSATSNCGTKVAFDPRQLVDATIEMSAGISRPKSVEWRLKDAARGRPFRPLGAYPEIAEACAEAGSSFYNVTKPLTVMLAHLRRRFRKMSKVEMRDALVKAKKESDDAEACALTLALSVNRPEVSALSAFDKEATEAIMALEEARQVVEDRLCEMSEGK